MASARSAKRRRIRGTTATAKQDEDEGCFAAALDAVRRFGGVLEHPAHSRAWRRFGLPAPSGPYWTAALDVPGWVVSIDQALYGLRARKRTWLYFVGDCPPPLIVRRSTWERRVDFMGSPERKRTPPAFRDLLLDMARTASGRLPCSLRDGRPDSHGFHTCDRCQHCAPPFVLEDLCPVVTSKAAA